MLSSAAAVARVPVVTCHWSRGTRPFLRVGFAYYELRPEMAIANNSSFAFAADTTAPTNSDEIVARWTPDEGFVLIVREGVQAADQPPGVGYGSGALGRPPRLLRSRLLRQHWSHRRRRSGRLSEHVDRRRPDAHAEAGVTVPDGQLAGPSAVDFIATFKIDATGQTYAAMTANWSTADVVVVNNGVVAEDGTPAPGRLSRVLRRPDLHDGYSVSPYNGHFAFRAGRPQRRRHSRRRRRDRGWPRRRRLRSARSTKTHRRRSITTRRPRITFFLNVVNSDGDYVIGGCTAPAHRWGWSWSTTAAPCCCARMIRST